MLNHLRTQPAFRPINTLSANFTVCDWAVTADESSDNLRFFGPWYYFALETRLRISEWKMLNFAECIAGKGKFCGRKLRKKLQGQACFLLVLLMSLSLTCVFYPASWDWLPQGSQPSSCPACLMSSIPRTLSPSLLIGSLI